MRTLERTKQWESFQESSRKELQSINNETESGAISMIALKEDLKNDLVPFIELLEMEMKEFEGEVMKENASFSDRRLYVEKYDDLYKIVQEAKDFLRKL